MKIRDGHGSATMTDVKNKIGDVFSVVDDLGEITITSYNKPAYKIIKLTQEAKQEIKQRHQNHIEQSIEKVTVKEEIQPTPEPEVAKPAEGFSISNKDIEPPVDKPSTEMTLPPLPEKAAPEEVHKPEEHHAHHQEPAKVEVTETVGPELDKQPEQDMEAFEAAVEKKEEKYIEKQVQKAESKPEPTAKDSNAITDINGSIIEVITTAAPEPKQDNLKPEKPAPVAKMDSKPSKQSATEFSRKNKVEDQWVQKVQNLL